MEENATPSMPVSRLDKFRQWFRVQAGNIFSPPYLPPALIVFFLVTVTTNLAIILMNQPLSYWSGGLDVKGMAVNGREMPFSFVELIGWWLLYVVIACLCLAVFNYRWSLIGWLAAEIMHLYAIQNWLRDCRFERWSLQLGALCQSFDPASFWFVAALLLGAALSIYFLPTQPVFANARMTRLAPRLIAAAPFVWVLVLLGATVWSARVPLYGWAPVETATSPGPLQEAEAAYDTKRSRLILFGGASAYLGNDRWDFSDQTWEWDGEDWINVSPAVSPEGRTRAGLAYDEERGRVVMFGGYGPSGPMCDTWEWDGREWLRKYPRACPSARYGHEMFFDSVRRKVVLYGGYDNKTFFNDAWEWDGENWVKIELEGDSPSASVYALAYNPDGKFALGLLSGWPGGTWTFKDNAWSRLYPDPEPSNRGWTGLAYDPQKKIFVTFGGVSKDTVLNDTWMFDGANWIPFDDSRLQPPIRSDHIIWYDRIRGRVMIFGGHNKAVEIYSDTWELILPEE